MLKRKNKSTSLSIKSKILIGFCFLVQISCTTKKIAIDLNEKENRDSAIFQIFNKTQDLTIGFTSQSYWWSDKYNYDVITRIGMEWNFFSLKAKRKKNGKWSTLKMKRKSINQELGNSILEYMNEISFLSLDNECLSNNEIIVNDSTVQQITISDGVNYKFEIIKNGNLQIIEAYEPEYYLEKKPNSICRKTFIDWTNKFLKIKKEIGT